MINAIIKGMMSLVISLVGVLLAPIDLLIQQFLPDLGNALTAFGNALNIAGNSIGWVISLSGISNTAISLIITYYTFKLTVPVLISTLKLAIKWYKALKL